MGTPLSRNEECYIVPESVYGEQEAARPVDTDQIPLIKITMPRNQQFLARRDKLGTRTQLQPIAGGDIEATIELEAHLIPSGTAATAPDMHEALKSLLGATYTVNTTVSSAASGTTITLASATDIGPTTVLGIGNEMRPVESITGSTVTMGAAFSATPSGGAAVKAVNYRPADPVPNGLDVYHYLLDPVTEDDVLSRLALGVVFGKGNFQIDTAQSILSIVLNGLATNVVSADTGGTIPDKPTGVVAGIPVASSFGKVFIGGVASDIHKASVQFDNGDRRRQVPVGSQVAPGISRGERKINCDFSIYLDEVTKDYYADAVNRTAKSLFIQIGNESGKMFGIWMPTLILRVPEPDGSAEEVILPFKDSFIYGLRNDEFGIAFG